MKKYVKASSEYAYDITNILDMFGVDLCTWDMIKTDYQYHTLVKTVQDAERFNYHSDYWGDAETYQSENVDLVDTVEPYIGGKVKITYDDGELVGTLKGVLIDKQYNSIGHTKLFIDPVDEELTTEA